MTAIYVASTATGHNFFLCSQIKAKLLVLPNPIVSYRRDQGKNSNKNTTIDHYNKPFRCPVNGSVFHLQFSAGFQQ